MSERLALEEEEQRLRSELESTKHEREVLQQTINSLQHDLDAALEVVKLAVSIHVRVCVRGFVYVYWG